MEPQSTNKSQHLTLIGKTTASVAKKILKPKSHRRETSIQVHCRTLSKRKRFFHNPNLSTFLQWHLASPHWLVCNIFFKMCILSWREFLERHLRFSSLFGSFIWKFLSLDHFHFPFLCLSPSKEIPPSFVPVFRLGHFLVCGRFRVFAHSVEVGTTMNSIVDAFGWKWVWGNEILRCLYLDHAICDFVPLVKVYDMYWNVEGSCNKRIEYCIMNILFLEIWFWFFGFALVVVLL